MKNIALILTTLIFSTQSTFAGLRDDIHAASLILGATTAAATAITGAVSLHKHKQLQRRKRELKRFEADPLRAMQVEAAERLSAKKWDCATGTFASFLLTSIAAWIATRPKDTQSPGLPNPHSSLVTPTGVVTPPVCDHRERSSTVDSHASTAFPSSAVPSVPPTPPQLPRDTRRDGIALVTPGQPAPVVVPSTVDTATDPMTPVPPASAPVARRTLLVATTARPRVPLSAPPHRAIQSPSVAMTRRAHRKRITKVSTTALHGSNVFVDALFDHYEKAAQQGRNVLLSGKQFDQYALPNGIEFLYFTDLRTGRARGQVSNKARVLTLYAQGHLGLVVKFDNPSGDNTCVITSDSFKLGDIHIGKLTIGVFDEAKGSGHILSPQRRRR